jgi:hypothetical protein
MSSSDDSSDEEWDIQEEEMATVTSQFSKFQTSCIAFIRIMLPLHF